MIIYGKKKCPNQSASLLLEKSNFSSISLYVRILNFLFPSFSEQNLPVVGVVTPHFENLLQDGNISLIYHLLTCFAQNTM